MIKKIVDDVVDKKGICFVIMPFGGYYDEYYNDIFVPSISKANLLPIRADNLFRPSPIIDDIWNLIKTAKVIIADLSEKNPNVFYELGLAHANQTPVILVSQKIDDIPFDLRGLRIIFYDIRKSNWADTLKDNIIKAIKETINSPVDSILPTFLKSNDINKKKGQKRYQAYIAESENEKLLKSKSALQSLEVDVVVNFDNFDLSFQELIDLKEDDVVQSRQTAEDPMKLFVNKVPWFSGWPGVMNGKRAFQVVKIFHLL